MNKRIFLMIILFLIVGACHGMPLRVFAQDNTLAQTAATLRMTGENIPADDLAHTIRDYLMQINLIDEDAEISVSGLPKVLKSNSSITAAVKTAAPTRKNIKLTVENYDLPDVEPSFLMFSDHPEKVSAYGALFSGACVYKKKVRFYFYHEGAVRQQKTEDRGQRTEDGMQNTENGNGLYLNLQFYNPSKTRTAQIYVLGAVLGPGQDVMKLGHGLNIEFLKKKNNGEGVIYSIPPGGSLSLFNQPLPYKDLFCGNYEFYLIDGDPVWFYLFSKKSRGAAVSYPVVSSSTDVHARGVYMVSDFTYDVKFKTGEREKYIIFGDTPLRNIFPHKNLAGNYGTIYDINLFAEENTGKSVKLEIIFQPRGGVATGTFIMDGRLVEPGFAKAKVEKKIWSYILRPYEKRLIKIKTLPEGSSNYPVRIIFRAVNGG